VFWVFGTKGIWNQGDSMLERNSEYLNLKKINFKSVALLSADSTLCTGIESDNEDGIHRNAANDTILRYL
jgi:hypothetical protein